MSVYIGCHLSSAGGFEEMGKRALEIEADTFAFFTRNPRGGKSKRQIRRMRQSFGKSWRRTDSESWWLTPLIP